MQNGEESKKSQNKAARKKPFSSWVKKLTARSSSRKRHGSPSKDSSSNSNPSNSNNTDQIVSDQAPQLGARIPSDRIDPHTFSSSNTQAQNGSFTSLPLADGTSAPHDHSTKSAAPTLATNPDTLASDGAVSKTNTSATINGAQSTLSGGGENSIFSSSNHSARSLTTTLTTIQSAAPSTMATFGGTGSGTPTQPSHAHNPSQGSSSIYFTHQYPTTPASAVPPHLQPSSGGGGAPSITSTSSTTNINSTAPQTYRSAIANNQLTDNASIVTLASSSQHARRRNSVDTNASVRAIAPSSQWGGSRESLPLSTLSQTTESAAPVTATSPSSASHTPNPSRPSLSGLNSSDRASVHSSAGTTTTTSTTAPAGATASSTGASVNAPALTSERNSVYANRAVSGDGSSIKLTTPSHGHAKTDSITPSLASAAGIAMGVAPGSSSGVSIGKGGSANGSGVPAPIATGGAAASEKASAGVASPQEPKSAMSID